MNRTRIAVRKRDHDCHAAVLDENGEETGKWAAGRSQAEAIGDLVLSHADPFNVEIVSTNKGKETVIK